MKNKAALPKPHHLIIPHCCVTGYNWEKYHDICSTLRTTVLYFILFWCPAMFQTTSQNIYCQNILEHFKTWSQVQPILKRCVSLQAGRQAGSNRTDDWTLAVHYLFLKFPLRLNCCPLLQLPHYANKYLQRPLYVSCLESLSCLWAVTAR